jgi:hypothetical protein
MDFYTDSIFSIQAGFYFFSVEDLLPYSKQDKEQKTLVPYSFFLVFFQEKNCLKVLIPLKAWGLKRVPPCGVLETSTKIPGKKTTKNEYKNSSK